MGKKIIIIFLMLICVGWGYREDTPVRLPQSHIIEAAKSNDILDFLSWRGYKLQEENYFDSAKELDLGAGLVVNIPKEVKVTIKEIDKNVCKIESDKPLTITMGG